MFPRTLLLALAGGLFAFAPQGPALVSAAISLTDALTDIETAYRHAGGGAVRFNFAGSNVLARQLVNGAPADLFISADQAQMEYAAARGVVEPAIPLLHNRLAIVTSRGRSGSVPDVNALTGVRRIAVGDPEAVPAGVYARTYLERRGLWSALQPNLLPLANVRAALNAVEAGGAEAGIVFESDVATASGVELAFVVDGPDAPRILYPAALVKASTNRGAAKQFLAFLQSSEASGIFRRYKFQPIPGIP